MVMKGVTNIPMVLSFQITLHCLYQTGHSVVFKAVLNITNKRKRRMNMLSATRRLSCQIPPAGWIMTSHSLTSLWHYQQERGLLNIMSTEKVLQKINILIGLLALLSVQHQPIGWAFTLPMQKVIARQEWLSCIIIHFTFPRRLAVLPSLKHPLI